MQYHSDEGSTLAGASLVTAEEEAAYVVRGIRALRAIAKWSKASIIAVARDKCVPTLQAKCNKYQNSQQSLLRKPPLIRVTSASELNSVADELAGHPRCSRAWVLVISGLIPDIRFDIEANIDRLHITRINKVDPQGALLVCGNSMWNGTQLGEWLKRSRRRELTRNKGVFFVANNLDSDTWSTTSGSLDNKVYGDRVQSYLRQLLNQQTGSSWWKNAKGPIAALVATAGLGIGAFKAKTVLSCSAKGFFISLQYGKAALTAGALNVKLLAAAEVAAAPVTAGVVAALLIYFVPWGEFFNWFGGWLKRTFSGIWDAICALCDEVRSMFLSGSSQQPMGRCTTYR